MNKASLIIAAVAALGFSTVSGFASSTSAPITGQSPAVTSTLPGGSIVVAADDSDSSDQQQPMQPKDDDDDK
jgi:membrane-associated protease RseP (regulator of RpoE activity)